MIKVEADIRGVNNNSWEDWMEERESVVILIQLLLPFPTSPLPPAWGLACEPFCCCSNHLLLTGAFASPSVMDSNSLEV